MFFEISENELGELLKEKFGTDVIFEEEKITFSAAMGAVRVTVFVPKTPLNFSEKFEISISMSLTVRMFLGKVKSELKKRNLQDVFNVSSEKVKVDLSKMKGSALTNWLRKRTLKKLEIKDKKVTLEL